MIAECRLYYKNNPLELKKIDEFENNYSPETVINCVGNLVCPNSFFSTTEDLLLAQLFVAGSCNSECVLFRIDISDSYYHNVINTSKCTCPFLKLEHLSQYQSENEVIFSMGALFRIESIEKYDMWYVCLKFEGENDESDENFNITEELQNGKYDWQDRCNVEDRILLLTEKFPQSSRNIVNIYIKYGVFHDINKLTSEETLTTYRKGFELLTKCLPNYNYSITVAMYLSIALHVAETYLYFDHNSSLICYNYLAVIHQLEDQYTEALSIYEKILSIAIEQDNISALLAIYNDISCITGDFDNYDYQMICLEKIVEIRKKLGCETLEDTYYNFGSCYERQENFGMALYYYKQYFLCLMNNNARMIDLMRIYSQIGNMYEKYNYYIAALQIYIRILMIELTPLPLYHRSLFHKYENVIKSIQRLIKCKYSKKLKHYFQLLISRSSSSILFTKFIKKIKILFYFELDHPNSLKTSLNILLKRVLIEYNNRRMYENSLKNLQRLSKQFLQIRSPCFAKIYYNTQMLQTLQSTLDDYRLSLYLIQRAYFSTSYVDHCEARKSYSSTKKSSTDIGRVINAFTRSSHATLCQNRIRQKPWHRHRSSWIYKYRFCGCFKDSSALWNRCTRRWVKFCKI
ncbi:unnamed protein product [Rotaria sp. Silwood2]|nr:unnamed protein product [Rotaria sp. Silwood2]CAF4058521.1 unnamed protein product [Rotaria sp. Silwood2]